MFMYVQESSRLRNIIVSHQSYWRAKALRIEVNTVEVNTQRGIQQKAHILP